MEEVRFLQRSSGCSPGFSGERASRGDAMPRAIWKGAITFGLVHVPVGLYPASQESDIDFDWLDERTHDPVGYKRINKRTGREIAKEHIVKGIERRNGKYVLLSDEEIRAAFPKRTQTIEIEGFVDAEQIPFVHFERPYYLAPVGKGDKVYALLREAMLDKGVVGLARVVLHTKEHLAALIPSGPALILNTLRWASEIRSTEGLSLPAAGRAATRLKPDELKVAGQLIQHLTSDWKPARYTDTFADAIRELVERKEKAGDTETVEPLETAQDADVASNVTDLAELLRKSLGKRKPAPARAPRSRRRAAKTARRKRA
jgi:DNA end-binding protein Ku